MKRYSAPAILIKSYIKIIIWCFFAKYKNKAQQNEQISSRLTDTEKGLAVTVGKEVEGEEGE